jgi:hypothetical protein
VSRNLARSKDGHVIHRVDCKHARMPWPGADKVSDDELLSVKLRFGYKVCRVCQPDFRSQGRDE